MSGVSKENFRTEIAALRDCQFAYCGEHAQSVRDLVNYLLDSLEAAVARAEQAETERDELLAIVSEESCPYEEGQCIKTTDPNPSPETLCRPCWLKWLKDIYGAEGAS